MAAHDMPLTADNLPHVEIAHSGAHLCNLAHILMANHTRHRHMLLAPQIPVVNVQVGTADGGFENLDQHLIIFGHRDAHLAQFYALFRGHLDQCIHHTHSLLMVYQGASATLQLPGRCR